MQAGFTALILPLGVQLVFLKEHAHLNPLIPAQYGRLLVTVWSAFFENGGKVWLPLFCDHVYVTLMP